MNLWRQRFILTPAVDRWDACHRQLGQAPPLQRGLICRGYRSAVPWQQVAREIKDMAPSHRPLALKNGLTDVVHPVDHDSILSNGEGIGLV